MSSRLFSKTYLPAAFSSLLAAVSSNASCFSAGVACASLRFFVFDMQQLLCVRLHRYWDDLLRDVRQLFGLPHIVDTRQVFVDAHEVHLVMQRVMKFVSLRKVCAFTRVSDDQDAEEVFIPREI